MIRANGNISDLRGERGGTARRSATEYLDIRRRQIGALQWAARAIIAQGRTVALPSFAGELTWADANICNNTAILLQGAVGRDGDTAARFAYMQLSTRTRSILRDIESSLALLET